MFIEHNGKMFYPEVAKNKFGQVLNKGKAYVILKGNTFQANNGFDPTPTDSEVKLNLNFQTGPGGVSLIQRHLNEGRKIVSFGNIPMNKDYIDVLNLLKGNISVNDSIRKEVSEQIRKEIEEEERAKIKEQLVSEKAVSGKTK